MSQEHFRYFTADVPVTETVRKYSTGNELRKGLRAIFNVNNNNLDAKVELGVVLDEDFIFEPLSTNSSLIYQQENGLPLVVPLENSPEKQLIANEINSFLAYLYLNIGEE